MKFAENSSRWGRRVQLGFEIAWKILALGALYGLSHWMIINSPIPKQASFADAVGTLGAAVTLFVILGSCGLLLFILVWKEDRRRYARQTILALGSAGLIFGLSLLLVNHYSIEKPLFGADSGGVALTAASLSIFVFSTLIALVALGGWANLETLLLNQIRKVVTPMVDEIKTELRGRSFSNAGYALGELSLVKVRDKKSKEDRLKVERPELLEASVESCRKGFYQLEHFKSAARLMALNNWLYYSTFQEGAQELPESSALQYARELEEEGRRLQAPWLQLTYCRVVARRVADLKERERARDILARITPKLSPYEQIEAQDCRKLFDLDHQVDLNKPTLV